MSDIRYALIGGTSLLEMNLFRQALQRTVDTPLGAVPLLVSGQVAFLQRHGLGSYTPPHAINHQAHFAAFRALGVEKILAVGSVGSLKQDIPPGSLLVPDDFFAPALAPFFHGDERSHHAPRFHPQWRQELLAAWRASPLPAPVDGGVYWQTTGPRFETPAEIRIMQPHVHVVGMTVAAECILASELGIPYAALCVVDNMANGLEAEPISFDAFKRQVKKNESLVQEVISALLPRLFSP